MRAGGPYGSSNSTILQALKGILLTATLRVIENAVRIGQCAEPNGTGPGDTARYGVSWRWKPATQIGKLFVDADSVETGPARNGRERHISGQCCARA